jgi:hypothetical protein
MIKSKGEQMKYIENMQDDTKTLFLRNLEAILMSHDLMSYCVLKEFRRKVAPDIINLLDLYEYDLKDGSYERLMRQYVENSIVLRRRVERLKMNNREFAG